MQKQEELIFSLKSNYPERKGVLVSTQGTVAPSDLQSEAYKLYDWLEQCVGHDVLNRFKMYLVKQMMGHSEYRIGDIVKVMEGNQTYPTYDEWVYTFMKHIPYPWDQDRNLPEGAIAEVVAIGRHENQDDIILGLFYKGYTYMISIDGVRLVERP